MLAPTYPTLSLRYRPPCPDADDRLFLFSVFLLEDPHEEMFARDQVRRLFFIILLFRREGFLIFSLPLSLLLTILNEMRLLITCVARPPHLIIKVVAPFPQTQECTFFFFVFSAMIGSSHSSLFPLVPSGWTLVVGL